MQSGSHSRFDSADWTVITMVNVRRLAAADMYGTKGSPRRRQIIRAEFFVGAAGCITLGTLALLSGSGLWLVLGGWLIAIGVNYVPLAAYAQALSRPGALEAEFAGRDPWRELRRAGVGQLWLLVPLAVDVAALAQGRRRSGNAGR